MWISMAMGRWYSVQSISNVDIYRDDHKSIYTNYFRTNHLHHYMYTSLSPPHYPFPVVPQPTTASPPNRALRISPCPPRRHRIHASPAPCSPRRGAARPSCLRNPRNRKTASRKLRHLLTAHCHVYFGPARYRYVHTYLGVLIARGGSPVRRAHGGENCPRGVASCALRM